MFWSQQFWIISKLPACPHQHRTLRGRAGLLHNRAPIFVSHNTCVLIHAALMIRRKQMLWIWRSNLRAIFVIKILTVCWVWSRWKHETWFGWSRFEPDSYQGHSVINFSLLSEAPRSENWTSHCISILRHPNHICYKWWQIVATLLLIRWQQKNLAPALTSQHTPLWCPGKNWQECCGSTCYQPSLCTQGR